MRFMPSIWLWVSMRRGSCMSVPVSLNRPSHTSRSGPVQSSTCGSCSRWSVRVLGGMGWRDSWSCKGQADAGTATISGQISRNTISMRLALIATGIPDHAHVHELTCSTPAGAAPAGSPSAAPGPDPSVTVTTTGRCLSSTVRHSPMPCAQCRAYKGDDDRSEPVHDVIDVQCSI
jgi:hypothetical protein